MQYFGHSDEELEKIGKERKYKEGPSSRQYLGQGTEMPKTGDGWVEKKKVWRDC